MIYAIARDTEAKYYQLIIWKEDKKEWVTIARANKAKNLRPMIKIIDPGCGDKK